MIFVGVNAKKISYWSGMATVHVTEADLTSIAKLLKKPIIHFKDDLYVYDGSVEYKARVKLLGT